MLVEAYKKGSPPRAICHSFSVSCTVSMPPKMALTKKNSSSSLQLHLVLEIIPFPPKHRFGATVGPTHNVSEPLSGPAFISAAQLDRSHCYQ